MIRIGRFPVQTPLGAWPGLGTQTHDQIDKNAVINIGYWGYPLENILKLALGQPNSRVFKQKISFVEVQSIGYIFRKAENFEWNLLGVIKISTNISTHLF